MISYEQIRQIHSKVKSGADFPQYIRDIGAMGVKGYETYVADGRTEYHDGDGGVVSSGPKYGKLEVAGVPDVERFRSELRKHQQGGSSYPEFCAQCAATGVWKWVVDLKTMTCTYYDGAGRLMLEESIPQ